MTTPRPRFWLALFLAFATIGIGLYAARATGEWAHFARSGAVLVILGAVFAAFDSLAAGNNPFAILKRTLSRDRMPSETLGLALMVVGTLIWGFGDLAPRVAGS